VIEPPIARVYDDDDEADVESRPTAVLMPFSAGIIIGGKFALQRVIASGAMGVVFEAWDLYIERCVALKLMHPHLAHDPRLVARFRREAQAAARIQHPNVVSVLEVGKRRDGTFYIVHELIPGQTLRDYIRARGRIDPGEALSIASPVMGGLMAAHARGIIHRDIKPENILLAQTPSGELVPKIIDFGVAKVTQETQQNLTFSGALVGTLQYMSPEQAQGQPVDARSDVWAMGVILFEMLSGSMPFEGPTNQAILLKLTSQPPARLELLAPECAVPFAPVIHRALARNPAERFSSMTAFRDELLATYARGARAFVSTTASTAPGVSPGPSVAPAADVEEELALDRLLFDENAQLASRDTIEVRPPPSERGKVLLVPPPQSGSEWHEDASEQREGDGVDIAEHALGVNALRDALQSADVALRDPATGEEARGRLWLVQAVAHHWLGNYAESARTAREALGRLTRGSARWHAAFGHLVLANGALGRKDLVLSSVDELNALEEEEDEAVASEPHIVTICRLTLVVVRTGILGLARRLLRSAQRRTFGKGAVGPFLRAWLDVARGELAAHEGDLIVHLRCLESSIDGFTSAGDVRSVCLQHVNVANAYVHFGAYERAVAALRQTIGVAEAMQLAFVSAAKVNLGSALAHVGRVDEAIATTSAALAQCARQGNRRAECTARIYLARMRAMQGALDEAVAMAHEAAEIAVEMPAFRAYALGTLASVLLSWGQHAAALGPANEAMRILERLRSIQEGESLVRLVHALALRGAGQDADAKRRIVEARRRLVEQADRIGEPRWRQSFLENVVDNARVMSTAAEWVGPG
jgi:serine/threonine protein kinase